MPEREGATSGSTMRNSQDALQERYAKEDEEEAEVDYLAPACVYRMYLLSDKMS